MALSHLIFSLFPLCGSFTSDFSGQILFLMHKGEAQKGLQIYLELAKEQNQHDFELLKKSAYQLIHQGIESKDPESMLLSIFGAGSAMSKELLPIFEKAIRSSEPKLQLVALNFLSRLKDDEADLLILEALGSPFLITRLQGCLELAKKNHPAIVDQLHGLIAKVPKELKVLFPQIVIHLETPEGIALMRQLLNDPDVQVRAEAALAAAKLHRDDFLPQIRKLATSSHPTEEESALFALGQLRDTSSINLCENALKSPRVNVKLAAAFSLCALGDSDRVEVIAKEALNANPFAISLLGKLKKKRSLLLKLLKHENRDIRLNAAVALLEMKEEVDVEQILLEKDMGYLRIVSPGGALKAWRTVGLASQREKNYPSLLSQTASFREKILLSSLSFSEEKFLHLSKKILDEGLTDLIPLLVEILRNRKNPEIVALLKEGAQKAGAPYIRNYCTLALYKMQEAGPYEQDLINWMQRVKDHPLICFKENEKKNQEDPLKPDEKSRFLIEVFETLTLSQNQKAIEALIHAMAYGNPKNRYALSGLLIKATE